MTHPLPPPFSMFLTSSLASSASFAVFINSSALELHNRESGTTNGQCALLWTTALFSKGDELFFGMGDSETDHAGDLGY